MGLLLRLCYVDKITTLELVNSCNYLGLIIDKGLTWKDHTFKIHKKLGPAIASMYRLNNCNFLLGEIVAKRFI
jgi:hypothetical protein